MKKYTGGTLITSGGAAVLTTALSGNFIAGMGAVGMVFGLAYMISGIIESVLRAVKTVN